MGSFWNWLMWKLGRCDCGAHRWVAVSDWEVECERCLRSYEGEA